MRATNAKIDLAAFGVRSIELPSFPGCPSPVNHVLRFQRRAPSAFERKKPAGRPASHGPRRPACTASSQLGLPPVCDTRRTAARPPDLTSLQTPCKVRGLMTTSSALSRIPASLVGLAGACAVILFVVISILPH